MKYLFEQQEDGQILVFRGRREPELVFAGPRKLVFSSTPSSRGLFRVSHEDDGRTPFIAAMCDYMSQYKISQVEVTRDV